MAKKILNVATFGLLGSKVVGALKKKKDDAPAADQKGPIITPLGPGVIPPNRKRSVGQPLAQRPSTILGGNYKLGD